MVQTSSGRIAFFLISGGGGIGVNVGSLESDAAFLPGRRRDSNDSIASIPALSTPGYLETVPRDSEG